MRSVGGLCSFDGIVQLVLRRSQKFLSLLAVTSHVVVIRRACTFHFLDRLYDMLMHCIEIMPIVDPIGHDNSAR